MVSICEAQSTLIVSENGFGYILQFKDLFVNWAFAVIDSAANNDSSSPEVIK